MDLEEKILIVQKGEQFVHKTSREVYTVIDETPDTYNLWNNTRDKPANSCFDKEDLLENEYALYTNEYDIWI